MYIVQCTQFYLIKCTVYTDLPTCMYSDTVISTCKYNVHSSIYLHVQCTQFYRRACTVYTVLSTYMYSVHSSIEVHVQCTQFYIPVCTMYTVLTTCMYSVHSSIYLHVQFVPVLMLVYQSVKVLKDVFVLFDDRWLRCSNLHSVVPEEIQHHFKNCKQFFSTNVLITVFTIKLSS